MDLADWLEMPLGDDDRARPEETPWLDWRNFELRNDKLAAVDPAAFHETAVLCVVRPWLYEVQARLLPIGGERRISRVRVIRGASGAARGKLLGRVACPSGRIGLGDYELLGGVLDSLDEAIAASLVARATGPAVTVHFDEDETKGALLPLFVPGVTAASYPVHELIQGDRRVGMEVVFALVPTS